MTKKVVLFQAKHGSWDKVFCRMPESLLSIAAVPHSKGYDVTIIDQRIHDDWKTRIRNLVKEKPLCVGVTALTGPCLKNIMEFCAIAKETDPTVPIILGGVHATLLPEQSLGHKNIDYVIKGEGDYAFCEFLEALEGKIPITEVKNLWHKKDEKVIANESAPLIMDLDSIPDLPYDLLDMDKYDAIDLGFGKSATLCTGRGCPFLCKFCANEVLQEATWRGLSPERLIQKIKILRDKYNMREFYFLDDCTSFEPKHFRKFLRALADLNPKIYWGTAGIRADLVGRLNDEDLDLLWESGCRSLDIGIETGSPRMMKFLQKAEPLDRMLDSNLKLARNKHPFNIKYTLIVGYPTETEEEMMQSLDFAKELTSVNPKSYSLFFVFLPIFGTAMFDLCVEHGFKSPERMEDWVNMDYATWTYHNDSWINDKKRKQLETIMISSLFFNENAKEKLTTGLSKVAYSVYHPIAKYRFENKFFGFPFETVLTNLLFKRA